jgi:hypothetical protein
MGAKNADSSNTEEDKSGTSPSSRLPSSAGANTTQSPRLTYQVILRHLAKFRDGARAVLDVFDTHEPEQPSEESHPIRGTPSAEPETKTPLQLRIERHMASVDQALIWIRDVNPEHKKKADLPPEIRRQILTKVRTLRDIVNAELHFWAASIENAQLSKFDEIEQKWIHRMIRSAGILGVDAEHKEHLDFLKNWASYERA